MLRALILLAALPAASSKGFDPDAAWVYTAQERASWKLGDSKAVFHGSATYRGTGFPVVCGEVSSAFIKASPQRYLVAGESILFELSVGQPQFDYTWFEFCR